MNAVNDGLDLLFEHAVRTWVRHHEGSLRIVRMRGIEKSSTRERERERYVAVAQQDEWQQHRVVSSGLD